jgi:hypothetical protein
MDFKPTLETSECRKIAQQYKEQGHQKWGFVIYRCTYTSDSDWLTFITKFRKVVLRTVEFDLASLPITELEEGVVQTLGLTVREDKSAFDRVGKDDLRKHFLAWRNSGAPETEQPNARACWDHASATMGVSLSTPRYQYFVQVDQAAMESCLAADYERADSGGRGYVNVIDSTWTVPMREDYALMDDEEMEEWPGVEGCTHEEVGWQKVELSYLYPEFYWQCEGLRVWEHDYVRPPGIALY